MNQRPNGRIFTKLSKKFFGGKTEVVRFWLNQQGQQMYENHPAFMEFKIQHLFSDFSRISVLRHSSLKKRSLMDQKVCISA